MTAQVRKQPATKLTLRLAPDTLRTVAEGVALGLAPSSNAFIDDAVRARTREVRHARLRQLAQDAMADPMFVADMHETMSAFDTADRSTWPEQEDCELDNC